MNTDSRKFFYVSERVIGDIEADRENARETDEYHEDFGGGVSVEASNVILEHLKPHAKKCEFWWEVGHRL